jgi:hypothetical protein
MTGTSETRGVDARVGEGAPSAAKLTLPRCSTAPNSRSTPATSTGESSSRIAPCMARKRRSASGFCASSAALASISLADELPRCSGRSLVEEVPNTPPRSETELWLFRLGLASRSCSAAARRYASLPPPGSSPLRSLSTSSSASADDEELLSQLSAQPVAPPCSSSHAAARPCSAWKLRSPAPWRTTRPFSSRLVSIVAPRIRPSGPKKSLTNLPKRLELRLSVVAALPHASSTSPARTTAPSNPLCSPPTPPPPPPPPPKSPRPPAFGGPSPSASPPLPPEPRHTR